MQWRIWCLYLTSHREEVLKTLQEEKVTREVCFIQGNYVYYGMEGECLPSSGGELNNRHRREVGECFETKRKQVSEIPSGVEKLFDFKV